MFSVSLVSSLEPAVTTQYSSSNDKIYSNKSLETEGATFSSLSNHVLNTKVATCAHSSLELNRLHFERTIKEIQKVSRNDGSTIFICRTKDDKEVPLKAKFIGSGTFGEVYALSGTKENVPLVLKVAFLSKIASKTEENQESLDREHRILTHLQKSAMETGGVITGIQKPPTRLYKVKDQLGMETMGYFAEKFDCDLVGYLSQNPSLVDTACKIQSLFKGLSFLHNRGVVHGDIKKGNIGVVDREFVISDFGGARFACEVSPFDPLGCHSYYSFGDQLDALKSCYWTLRDSMNEDEADFQIKGVWQEVVDWARSKALQITNPTICNKMFAFLKKSPEKEPIPTPFEMASRYDVYCLGMVVKESLSEAFLSKHPHIKELIKSMTHPNPDERSNIVEATRQYCSLTAKFSRTELCQTRPEQASHRRQTL